MTPAVSVVIPSYNYASYVREAVDSALAQTLPPLEVIVVDDGSQDNTREIMAAYASDPRVRYIYQDNRGLSGARNTGIRHARAELVAFLDADDRWRPEKLEQQVNQFQVDEKIGLVFCGMESFDERGRTRRFPTKKEFCENVAERLVIRSLFCPSTAVVHRKCFEDCGYFDESLPNVEDRDMWLRIAQRYHFGCVPDCLVQMRVHSNAWSRRPQGMDRAFQEVLRRAFARPPLQGRLLLRGQAHAVMHLDLAWVYHAAGVHGAAWRHVALAFLAYPLPDFGARLFRNKLVRWRMLIRYTFTPNHDRGNHE